MKSLIVFVAICIVGVLSYVPHNQLNTQWQHFKELHQKTYDEFEESKRQKIFETNLEIIQNHNSLYDNKEVSFKMGVNQFADLNNEELVQPVRPINKYNNLRFNHESISDIPDAIDWREKGAVTDVKNQAICSAWAYSVTGALEGQNFLKNGELIPLSEQELSDCASENGCSGGGTIEDGYHYVIDHGLASETDYPHLDDGSCHRGSIPSSVTESAYVSIDNSEESLRKAVAAVGPISVGVNAANWALYAGGIFKCRATGILNHGALLVGYGSEDGVDYWLVKNSWGASWGEDGYIRVERSIERDCGITMAPTYPVVN